MLPTGRTSDLLIIMVVRYYAGLLPQALQGGSTHSYLLLLMGARLEGKTFNPLKHRRLDGNVGQVSRVNHEGTPEHITKRKLAFEISKLVGDNIGAIRVCATFASVDQLVKPVGQPQA